MNRLKLILICGAFLLFMAKCVGPMPGTPAYEAEQYEKQQKESQQHKIPQ